LLVYKIEIKIYYKFRMGIAQITVRIPGGGEDEKG